LQFKDVFNIFTLTKTVVMKNILLISLASFCFLCGCKKAAPPFDEYFRMMIDGLTYDKNYTTDASFFAAGGNYLTINANTQNVGMYITLTNARLGEIPVSDNLNSLEFTLSDYDQQTQYYAGDGGIQVSQIGSGKINILELTQDHVKGTFEFVSGPAVFSNQKKIVTDGAFNVKITH
jgi:hypothetical protein